ncbi:MAG: hypothetical protein FJW23_13100 [Acidimicrobiia bacterium]|nr:hypothetical protein [Acidimicrobiia bacterium]
MSPAPFRRLLNAALAALTGKAASRWGALEATLDASLIAPHVRAAVPPLIAEAILPAILDDMSRELRAADPTNQRFVASEGRLMLRPRVPS